MWFPGFLRKCGCRRVALNYGSDEEQAAFVNLLETAETPDGDWALPNSLARHGGIQQVSKRIGSQNSHHDGAACADSLRPQVVGRRAGFDSVANVPEAQGARFVGPCARLRRGTAHGHQQSGECGKAAAVAADWLRPSHKIYIGRLRSTFTANRLWPVRA
jgi:hypothetical protein